MRFQTINPATEEIIKEYETQKKEDVYRIAEEVKKGYEYWRWLTISERAKYMRKITEILRKRKNEFAELITTEMGKPITQSLAEIEKCAWTSEIYAENSEKWLEEELIIADGKKHIVRFEPLGVILSIMPWNFPFWQAFRFGIPALMAGNTSILKHSSAVTGSSLAIESIFKEVSLENVFKTIITTHDITNELINTDYIAGVSLTGSVQAGQSVAKISGLALKKCVLELGGSDPFIVLEDADIENASNVGVKARFMNTGQSCISAKRFIVAQNKEKEFTERFVSHTKNLKMGDPMDELTDIGPLINRKQIEELASQLSSSVNSGAKILTGGKRVSRKGFYFEPTVVSNAIQDMRIFKEEVFGPIAPIINFKDVSDAVKIANNSEFGLGASIWTKNQDYGLDIAKKLQTGCVFINNLVKSDPRVPFGGIKKSGIGRELSTYGLREFVNIKTINVY